MTDISVIVPAYNHEKYLTQCLESILCQAGDSSFELIIGDDCSTDNTLLIAKDYQSRHPEIIKLLPTQVNLGITKNLKRCLDACTGEYIAICEGDDFWIDPEKLYKQKSFLDTHPTCSMCFSALMLLYEDTHSILPHDDQVSLDKEFYSADDLILRNFIGNFSCCMYRSNAIRNLPPGIFDLYTVDWFFNISCAQLGDIGYLGDRMSVYRLHAHGAWTGKGQLEKLEELKTNIDIYNEFLNYKHDYSFTLLKQGVEDEMSRIRES